MTTEPKLEQRDAQHYVAIRTQVPMNEIASVVPLHGEVMAFLQRQGAAPSGAPFFRYIVVDMEGLLDMEIGWPVASAVPGEGRVSAGVFPAGRYATVLHTGHPAELEAVTGSLLAWADENGVSWKTSDNGTVWAARIEHYLTDPADEPDMNKWQTELAFLTAEG